MTTKKVWKIRKRERAYGVYGAYEDSEQTDICIVYDEEEAKNVIAYLANIQDTSPFEWTSRNSIVNETRILVILNSSILEKEVVLEADLIEIVE